MSSFCTRNHPDGPREILPEEFIQFLLDDHLCVDCAGTTDSEHAQQGVLSFRQSTLPPEVAA